MYYLPIFVNQRRYHYCKLLPETSSTFAEPFHFIVEHHPGFHPVLIRLSEGTKLLSGQGTEEDWALKDRTLFPTTEYQAEKNQILILFKEVESQRIKPIDELNKGLEKAPVRWQEQDGHWVLRFTGADEAKTLGLRIQVEKENESCEGRLFLHIGKSEHLFDAVFDFGSEASQIAVKQRSQESRRDHRVNMLDRLLFDFYAPALKSGRSTRISVSGEEGELSPWNVEYSRYYQHDEEDDKLFRSSFLIRRSYDNPLGWDQSLALAPFEEGDQEWVSILGDTYDPQLFNPRNSGSYELIPNLKLAELGYIRDFKLQLGNRLAHFSDDSVHESAFRRLMNEFLHILLAELESSHSDKREKFLRLSLLVPNIYSQRRIHGLLQNLQKDFAELRRRNGYGFSGMEVQTLSESDASFLGLLSDPSVEGLRQNELKPGENYLIIDIGKGTTDLSVISMGEERDQFSSVFRSGFAGAGNAMTYAFIETIAALVGGVGTEAGRVEVIHRIMDAEIQQKLELMRWVEKLKRKFYPENLSSGSLADLKPIRDLNPSSPTFLSDLNRILEVDFARKNKTIADHFGFVEQAIAEITARTVALIRRSGVRKFPLVVLSGRGFLLHDLRTGMEKALQEAFSIGRFLVEEKKLKTSCLYGPINFPAGTNKNSDLVGTPVVTERNSMAAIRNWWFRGKDRSKDLSYTEADLHQDEFYLEGQDLDLQNQRITISGRELMLPGTLMADGNDEVNLLFVGQGFLARSPKGCLELQFGHEGHDNPLSDPLAWKSLFPYVIGPVPVTPVLKKPKPENTLVAETQTESRPEPVPNLEMLSISSPPVREEKPVTKPEPPEVPKSDDMWDYL